MNGQLIRSTNGTIHVVDRTYAGQDGQTVFVACRMIRGWIVETGAVTCTVCAKRTAKQQQPTQSGKNSYAAQQASAVEILAATADAEIDRRWGRAHFEGLDARGNAVYDHQRQPNAACPLCQQQPTVPPADDAASYPPEPPQMFTREWFNERGFERGARVANERKPERFGTITYVFGLGFPVISVRWDGDDMDTDEHWSHLAPLGYSAAI